MVALNAMLWVGSAWAQDPWDEVDWEPVDAEALLLETEVAIESHEPADAVDLGILETEVERPEPRVFGAPDTDGPILGEAGSFAPGPPFGTLLERALARGGDTSSLARDVARARFLPRLTLLGRREARRTTASDTAVAERRWWMELHLCFGACGTNLAVDEIEGDFAPDLMVTAGEVVELDDRGAYASAATRVLADAATSRLTLADRLAAVYARRALLRAQRATTLVDEIRRVLDLAETEAQLDLYTDGWFAKESR
jgi:hypothetical protein